MTDKEKFETLVHQCEFDISCAEDIKKDWIERHLDSRPYEAFDWCETLMENLQRAWIATQILGSLQENEIKGVTKKDRMDFLKEFVTKEMKTMAQWPKRSTSTVANLNHQYRLAALARISEYL